MLKRDLKKHIDKHLKTWIKKLGIEDYKYDIEVGYSKALRCDYAQIETEEDTRNVFIQFNPRMCKTEEEVKNTVIHELLHTRMNEYYEFVEDLIKTYVNSPKTRKMMFRQIGRLEHKIVIPLTTVLAQQGEK